MPRFTDRVGQFLVLAFCTLSWTPQAWCLQESEPIEKPTLVGMAYLLSDEADSFEGLSVFDSVGESVDPYTMLEIRESLKVDAFKYPEHVKERVAGPKPIVFVFNVDNRLTDSGVVVWLKIDGKEIPSRSWMTGENDGLLTSFVVPPDGLKEWPDSAELRIRFSDKNPSVLARHDGKLDQRIELINNHFCEIVSRSGANRFSFSRPMPDETKPVERFVSPKVKLVDGSDLKLEMVEIQSLAATVGYSKSICVLSPPVSSDDIASIELIERTFEFQKPGEVSLRPTRQE